MTTLVPVVRVTVLLLLPLFLAALFPLNTAAFVFSRPITTADNANRVYCSCLETNCECHVLPSPCYQEQ